MKRDEHELSPKQRTIMQLSWEGLSIKDTAAFMGLSARTVKNYRRVIFEKLDITNVESMLRVGVQRGLIDVRASHLRDEWPGVA